MDMLLRFPETGGVELELDRVLPIRIGSLVRFQDGSLGGQFSVSQAFTTHPGKQGANAILGIDLAVAFVQPESKLVHIPVVVFRAPVMIHPVKSALEHGPHALGPVRVRHAVDKFLRRVFDRLMGIVV